MRATYGESVPIGSLQTRLHQVSAQYLQEHSTGRRHVYYSGSLGMWLTVERRGGIAQLSYYPSCPCG